MNKLSGIPTLNAGAPDLRLTGDQTQRGTYVQRRRNQMAYGGIAGLDGRKRYGIGSWFQEKIMDPIKENPEIAALVGGTALNQWGLPDIIPGAGTTKGMGQNWLGDLLGKIPGVPDDVNLVLGDDIGFTGGITSEKIPTSIDPTTMIPQISQDPWYKKVAQTINVVQTFKSHSSTFYMLDVNDNPCYITNPEEFLKLLIERNQETLNAYHQLFEDLKRKRNVKSLERLFKNFE